MLARIQLAIEKLRDLLAEGVYDSDLRGPALGHREALERKREGGS